MNKNIILHKIQGLYNTIKVIKYSSISQLCYFKVYILIKKINKLLS